MAENDAKIHACVHYVIISLFEWLLLYEEASN